MSHQGGNPSNKHAEWEAAAGAIFIFCLAVAAMVWGVAGMVQAFAIDAAAVPLIVGVLSARAGSL